jgi:hypothetical protein
VHVTPFTGMAALEKLMDSLHDERFDASSAVYERGNRQWSARFLRRVHDTARIARERTGLFRTRLWFPVVETTLVLSNVTAVRSADVGNTGTDIFIGCEETVSGLKLRTALWIEIELDVDGPITGEVRERELELRGYVDRYLGAEHILRLEGLE